MYQVFFQYELFGYIAIIFNLTALFQKSTKRTLIFLLIASISFLLNMLVLDLPKVSIFIAFLGLCITIISLILYNHQNIKEICIKISP